MFFFSFHRKRKEKNTQRIIKEKETYPAFSTLIFENTASAVFEIFDVEDKGNCVVVVVALDAAAVIGQISVSISAMH